MAISVLFFVFLTILPFLSVNSHVVMKTTTSTHISCTSNVHCLSGFQYCANDDKCHDIKYSPLVSPSPSPSSSSVLSPGEKFSLVMMSDIQFFFKKCKDEPLTECIFHNLKKAIDKKSALSIAAGNVKACAEHLAKVYPVRAFFDNGDLTTFGTAIEANEISSFHASLQQLPFIISLGNHDYAMYGDEPSVRMVNYFESVILKLHNRLPLSNIDLYTSSHDNTKSGLTERYTRGSLSYSLEIENHMFIMLHWSTHGRKGFTKSYVHSNHHVEITTPTNYLVNEITKSKQQGKPVYLVVHSWKSLAKYVKNMKLESVFSDSVVKAVFTGHDHDAYGRNINDWDLGNGVALPIYYAGSASYQKLIHVSMKAAGAGIQDVTVFDTKFGDKCHPTASSPNND